MGITKNSLAAFAGASIALGFPLPASAEDKSEPVTRTAYSECLYRAQPRNKLSKEAWEKVWTQTLRECRKERDAYWHSLFERYRILNAYGEAGGAKRAYDVVVEDEDVKKRYLRIPHITLRLPQSTLKTNQRNHAPNN
jgi:hypothetical protein